MKTAVLVMLGFLLMPIPAKAERIEMKNGDRITGRWLDADEDTVRFVSRYGSVVRVPREEIASYTDDHGLSLPIPGDAPEPLPPPKEASATIEEQKEKFLGATWKSRVNAGAGLQTGNTDQKSLSADFETKAKWDKDRANLDIDYNWQETDDERSQDNREIAANFDRFLPPSVLGDDRWYVNFNGNLRQDKVANLDLRSVLGVGLGRQFYETEATYLSASVGPSWLRQDYEGDETKSSLAARWNIDYDQKFFENLFSLFHKHSLYVPTEDVSAYIFDADTGLRIPIRDGFSATAEWQLNVNQDPAIDTESDDSIYTLKLGYEW